MRMSSSEFGYILGMNENDTTEDGKAQCRRKQRKERILKGRRAAPRLFKKRKSNGCMIAWLYHLFLFIHEGGRFGVVSLTQTSQGRMNTYGITVIT